MPGAARPDAVEHARHPRFVIGDEDERGSSSEASTSQDVPPAREPASILRARRPTLKQDKVIGSGCGEKVDPKKPERTAAPPPWLKDTYSWIRPHLDWKGMRPVLRSSAAAWCSLLLLLIDSSREALGQGAFLVLVGECKAGIHVLDRTLTAALQSPPSARRMCRLCRCSR